MPSDGMNNSLGIDVVFFWPDGRHLSEDKLAEILEQSTKSMIIPGHMFLKQCFFYSFTKLFCFAPNHCCLSMEPISIMMN